jgi:uncharacterized protein
MSTYQNFKEKLENQHKFPTEYLFKFIVPRHREDEMYSIFSKDVFQKKLSKAGNYVSFTARVMMKSSDEVMEIYEKAYKIKGIISL